MTIGCTTSRAARGHLVNGSHQDRIAALTWARCSTFGMISCFSRLRPSSVFEHARRAGNRQRQRLRRTTASRGRSADIRAWAKDQSVALSGRGRIPASIVHQYEAVTEDGDADFPNAGPSRATCRAPQAPLAEASAPSARHRAVSSALQPVRSPAEAASYIRPRPARGLLVLQCSWADPCPVTTCAGWYCAAL
jgi:hypothetical protein